MHTTEKALSSPSFSQRSFVCCYDSTPAARCYSGSRDQGKLAKRGNTLASMEKRPFRLTTLAKLSVDVSDVFSREVSIKGLQ